MVNNTGHCDASAGYSAYNLLFRAYQSTKVKREEKQNCKTLDCYFSVCRSGVDTRDGRRKAAIVIKEEDTSIIIT